MITGCCDRKVEYRLGGWILTYAPWTREHRLFKFESDLIDRSTLSYHSFSIFFIVKIHGLRMRKVSFGFTTYSSIWSNKSACGEGCFPFFTKNGYRFWNFSLSILILLLITRKTFCIQNMTTIILKLSVRYKNRKSINPFPLLSFIEGVVRIFYSAVRASAANALADLRD